MNVVVDFGNTSAKVGIFDNGKLSDHRFFHEASALQNFLQNFFADAIIISSVNTPGSLVAEWAPRIPVKFILDHRLPLPIVNSYETPETLGMDRLAAVCGAYALTPNRDCLVIDSGTCITYDMIDKNGHYVGGGISPGLSMRFKAMHTFTARLPLVSPGDDAPLIGKTTASCMQGGTVRGILYEIEGMIHAYQEKYPELQVFLCGGDTSFFEKKLKASIFAVPELVLYGLNRILQHNAQFE